MGLNLKPEFKLKWVDLTVKPFVILQMKVWFLHLLNLISLFVLDFWPHRTMLTQCFNFFCRYCKIDRLEDYPIISTTINTAHKLSFVSVVKHWIYNIFLNIKGTISSACQFTVGHKSHCLKSWNVTNNEATIWKQETLFWTVNDLKMLHMWASGCWVMPWVDSACASTLTFFFPASASLKQYWQQMGKLIWTQMLHHDWGSCLLYEKNNNCRKYALCWWTAAPQTAQRKILECSHNFGRQLF